MNERDEKKTTLARPRRIVISPEVSERFRVEARADFAGECLALINALAAILGEPPEEALRLRNSLLEEYALGSKFKKSQLAGISEHKFSDEELKQLYSFSKLPEADRKLPFLFAHAPRAFSKNLSYLFEDRFIVCDNGDVKEIDRSNYLNEGLQPSFKGAESKPRWAEENRPGVRFPMRLNEKLISEIDVSAEARGLTRTEWFVKEIQKALSPSQSTPPDSPEFKSTRPISIRITEELNEQIERAATDSGLSKTEWVRRVARQALLGSPWLAPGPHRN